MNIYIFGDFDLAGICIYQSEFINFGATEQVSYSRRYKEGQVEIWKCGTIMTLNILDIKSEYYRFTFWMGWLEMIHHYGRVYEQEGYIENVHTK